MKKLIIFLLCFTLLAVGVTYGCIQYTLRSPATEETIEEAGIDLNGFYDENDLIVNEVQETLGDANLTYPQIEGLKNKQVQDAVNLTIRSEVERMKSRYAELGTNIQYLSSNIHGNFANVLSVGLYSGDDTMHYEQVYLNFNLNDGSMLLLEDLFGRQADLTFIVHSAFYDALTRGNLYQTYDEEHNYPDEQALYKTVKAYLSGERKFALSPSEISLYYEDYVAAVSMVDFADSITIYSKYLTEESLFVEDGIGYDGVFTCAKLPQGFERRQFGFAADNFWYDIALPEAYVDERIPTDKQERFLAFYDELYNGLMAEAAGIRDLAQTNPHKAYVLLAKPDAYMYTDSQRSGDVWLITPSNVAEVNENYMLYEMSAELFESKYRAALTELYRTGTYSMFYGGLDQYIDGNEVQAAYRRSSVLYNYETGEPLALEDLFVEGYDYMDAVRRAKKYDLTSYYGYTLEDAERALQGAWCELDGMRLNVYLPEWGTEQYLTMSLREFPRTALKIFE